MQYKYVTEQQDYSDYTSGRVFYSLPGYPAFPVRLASEIFQRCQASRGTLYNIATPCTLYDPCCGAGYHLSVLGFLHGESIREVIASDIDERAVAVARRNLGLLSMNGLETRIAEISQMLEQYGKDSHQHALRSAYVLKDRLDHSLSTRTFQASTVDAQEISSHIQPKSVDLVFTDVPYGQHSRWQVSSELTNPLGQMLEALLDVLSPTSIVAVASDKGQKALHEGYQRIEQFQIGRRRVVILKPV